MSYIAFVPARSGSKRVPGKNIKILADKPLFIHTLEAFIHADKVDKVILSTDSEEYWELAKSFIKSKKLVLDYRSSNDAGDKIKIFDYLKDNCKDIFGDFHDNDVFLMGLPTVPLRRYHHVNEAVVLFEKKNKAIFSATEYGFPVTFAFNLTDENAWAPISKNSPMLTGNTRSQDQKTAYHPNGAIYIRRIADLLSPDLSTLYHNALPYLMSRADSVDIDNKIDFLIAEAIIDSEKEKE